MFDYKIEEKEGTVVFSGNNDGFGEDCSVRMVAPQLLEIDRTIYIHKYPLWVPFTEDQSGHFASFADIPNLIRVGYKLYRYIPGKDNGTWRSFGEYVEVDENTFWKDSSATLVVLNNIPYREAGRVFKKEKFILEIVLNGYQLLSVTGGNELFKMQDGKLEYFSSGLLNISDEAVQIFDKLYQILDGELILIDERVFGEISFDGTAITSVYTFEDFEQRVSDYEKKVFKKNQEGRYYLEEHIRY